MLVQATKDSINMGFFTNGKLGPTQNPMLVDNELIADAWNHLWSPLACDAESLCILLDKTHLRLRKIMLSIGKYYENICPCARKKPRVIINIRNLTLSFLDDKCKNLIKILLTAWNSSRKRFTLHEAVFLLGFVSIIALETKWVKHTRNSL